MNFRAIGQRVRASVLAVAAGWATATLLTLPMQFYEIVTNNIYGRRTLLWSLVAGTLIWIGWTLLIAVEAWLLVCLPTIAIVREEWLLRHRGVVIAVSGFVTLVAAFVEINSWRIFSPDFTFHPWMFFLYALLLVVFATVTAATYLRIVGRLRSAK